MAKKRSQVPFRSRGKHWNGLRRSGQRYNKGLASSSLGLGNIHQVREATNEEITLGHASVLLDATAQRCRSQGSLANLRACQQHVRVLGPA